MRNEKAVRLGPQRLPKRTTMPRRDFSFPLLVRFFTRQQSMCAMEHVRASYRTVPVVRTVLQA